ncbi:MAG: antibiotic biosynthesis monooxygenase family protein [Planctomycetota bacterium]
MVTIGMNYKLIPGKDEEFVSVFTKVMGIMEEIDGHKETHLFRDVHNEHDYLVVSEWTDKGAFDGFIASDRFKNVASWGKENVLRERPSHEVYGGDEPAPAGGGCPMH